MALNSIDQLLQVILAQPQWEKQQRFHELVKCWYQIINVKVAQNTRPYCLRDDNLSISTSSSVWAQELSLQRYQLLNKINRRASQPIKELSFSSAKWYPHSKAIEAEVDINTKHPSLIEIDHNSIPSKTQRSPLISNPQEAMNQWWAKVKQRSHSLPLCPQCQASTPEGELARWGICACCFAQQLASVNSEPVED